MTRPLPKFCVGEEVMLRSKNQPDKNIDRVEVIAIGRNRPEYRTITTGGAPPSPYSYGLAHTGSHFGWDESALRKLPPEERTSWEDCAWQPDRETFNNVKEENHGTDTKHLQQEAV